MHVVLPHPSAWRFLLGGLVCAVVFDRSCQAPLPLARGARKLPLLQLFLSMFSQTVDRHFVPPGPVNPLVLGFTFAAPNLCFLPAKVRFLQVTLSVACLLYRILSNTARLNTHWTIEAPARSSFWSTPFGKSHLSRDVDVQLSTFGSTRAGAIRLASSLPTAFNKLQVLGNDKGDTATSEVVLRRFYAAVAHAMFAALHVSPGKVPSHVAAQISLGCQPRKHAPNPVPEFKGFATVRVSALPLLCSKNRLLNDLHVGSECIPKGAKLMGRTALSSAAPLPEGGGVKGSIEPQGMDHSAGPSPRVPLPAPLPSGLGGSALGLSGLGGISETTVADNCAKRPRGLGTPAAPTGAVVVSSEAEHRARSLSSPACENDLLHIFDALPHEKPARGVKDAREKAWSAGAYCQGTLCGLRKNTRCFPFSVKAAVSLLRTRLPQANFSCIAIYANTCTPFHRDRNNLAGSLNYVLPLTDFSKGEIWLADDNGEEFRNTPEGKLRGRSLDVSKGPVAFDAHGLHCTLLGRALGLFLLGFVPTS